MVERWPGECNVVCRPCMSPSFVEPGSRIMKGLIKQRQTNQPSKEWVRFLPDVACKLLPFQINKLILIDTKFVIILLYCRSGNIREVLIFVWRTNVRIQESHENNIIIALLKKKENLRILNFLKNLQDKKFAKMRNYQIFSIILYFVLPAYYM